MRACLVLALLAVLASDLSAAEGAATLPYERWTVSEAIMGPGARGAFDDVTAKDPSPTTIFPGSWRS